MSLSLPQLAKFGAVRPSAAPAGATPGPAAGGASPSRVGDPSSLGAGGLSHPAQSAAEPLDARHGVRHNRALCEEQSEGSSQAGTVEQTHAEVAYSSGTGQSGAAEATHVVDRGSKEPQQKSAAEAPTSSIVRDARLVFEAAAAVGVAANIISRAVQQYERLVHGMQPA